MRRMILLSSKVKVGPAVHDIKILRAFEPQHSRAAETVAQVTTAPVKETIANAYYVQG